MTKETLNKANKISGELSDLRSKLEQLCGYSSSEGGINTITYSSGMSSSFYITKTHEDIIKKVARFTMDLMEEKIEELEKELKEL